MSMIAATKKKADEALIRSLPVQRNYTSKYRQKRNGERYKKYTEAVKQMD